MYGGAAIPPRREEKHSAQPNQEECGDGVEAAGWVREGTLRLVCRRERFGPAEVRFGGPVAVVVRVERSRGVRELLEPHAGEPTRLGDGRSSVLFSATSA